MMKEVGQYLQEKEFVDTVVIPLIPLDLSSTAKQTASMGEYILYVSAEIERQFKGRMLLLPSYSYWVGEEGAVERLQAWENQCREAGAKHVFFITSDVWWQQAYTGEGTLLWLPAVPMENFDEEMRRKVVRDSVSGLIASFTEAWT
ncbi:YpiF family protein [Litoribacterium kuwaitense]|uniref:YpiF family protein n=1 Tax=Litoribacterium kuwaitense TaxID=1398745 RepID=UPI001FE8C36D|nr:YpiF family protein [Litoribacterium kuwaitense]